MLKLNLQSTPYWIDLPAQVRVKVTPITTAIMSAAQAMALESYRNMVDSSQLDPENQAIRKGTSESLLITALAQLSILEWEGVIAAEGDGVAPLNAQSIADLMTIWLVAQEFLKAYVTQFKLLETEGNVSAPAASGISAVAAPIAANAI